MPRGNTGTDLWTIAEPWEGWRSLEGRIWANPSTLLLKVQETPELQPEQSARPVTPSVIHDQSRHVGTSARRHVGTSARRHVGTSASFRHPARERSSAMIELESPGQRCLPRTTTGDQHTPRADYRNFGADSLGGGGLSLRWIYLINLDFN